MDANSSRTRSACFWRAGASDEALEHGLWLQGGSKHRWRKRAGQSTAMDGGEVRMESMKFRKP